MPYDGCAYRVSKVVGYIGSGTRTNHKRKIESTIDEDDTDGGSDNGGRNFGSSGGDQDGNSSSILSLDSKLQGKPPEEATRILRGALKKFRKKCNAGASTIRGGDSNDVHYHASEAAAYRTHAAAVGRQARRGKAEQARYNKMRQHQNRKEGRPGNQVQAIKHKKVIKKNVARAARSTYWHGLGLFQEMQASRRRSAGRTAGAGFKAKAEIQAKGRQGVGACTRTLSRKSENSCVMREKVRDEHKDERARACFLCLLVLCVSLSFRAHAHLSSGLSYGDVPLVRLRCASGGIKPHCLAPLPRDFRLTLRCSLRLASFLLGMHLENTPGYGETPPCRACEAAEDPSRWLPAGTCSCSMRSRCLRSMRQATPPTSRLVRAFYRPGDRGVWRT